MEKSIKRFGEDLKSLLNYRPYFISVLLISILSFGYAMFNTAISIDDLEYDRYVGSGNAMLAAGRFGIWFWSFIEGKFENAYLIDMFAIILFILAATTMCVIFRRVTSYKISAGALTVFSCMFISYPLMNELWEYTGANVNVCGAFFFSALTILLMHEQIHCRKWRNPWRIIISSLMMMIVCAGYESVVPVYIFFVFAVLAMQMIYGKKKERKFLEFIRQGLIYASVLAAGLVLRIIVHRITLSVLDLTAKKNGETKIFWGTRPAKDIIKFLLNEWTRTYIVKGAIYFPVAVFVAALIIFFALGIAIVIKKRRFLMLVPGAGMLLCLVLLSLVQGTISPYRTCQVFAAFVAFVFMIVIESIPRSEIKPIKWTRVTALILCGYLCFSQASYMNNLFEANYRRSESEAFTVRQISVDLRKNFDTEKPVIFVGSYPVDPSILESISIPEDSFKWKMYTSSYEKVSKFFDEPYDIAKLPRKLPGTNVRSLIHWSLTAFSSQTAMLKVFTYYGYSYVPADYSVYNEAKAYATENAMPEYPQKGYIKDVGDYIIVNL